MQKPLIVEISGINMELRTIYLSRDYKKDYKNYRTKFLNEWKKASRIFTKFNEKDSLVRENNN